MRIGLTYQERFIEPTDIHLRMLRSLTLAWRAFGKAIGIEVQDPMMGMDGDGSQFEPTTRRYFQFEEAKGDRFLSLGHYGAWDGGAMRSLSPSCIYVSYSADPDGRFVDFHGWHRPKGESRIIAPEPGGLSPFLTKDGLSSMAVLISSMQALIEHAKRR